MRLLSLDEHNKIILSNDLNHHTDRIPPYAILSHTWGPDSDEVTLLDLQQRRGQSKAGYAKIQFCGEQARQDEINHFWVDTCCINKENHVELSEAITSMFRWYQNAVKCYVHLADVSARQDDGVGDTTGGARSVWESSLRGSRWFRRGWTLQELLAPTHVEFFSREGIFLGTKETLEQQIHEITAIPLAALHGIPLCQFSTDERLRWTKTRQTKKKEDGAYCLLGIFNVFMPLIYGEGDNAFRRLEKEIDEQYGRDVIVNKKSIEVRSLGMCLTLAPLIKPEDFVGRAAEIEAIHGILRPDGAPLEQRWAILGGLGGMGKTQLAIAYARQQQRSYTSVLWLNASSELTLHTSLRSVTSVLLPADQLINLDNEQALTRVREWLSCPYNTQWLLIFDNYDDPDQFDIGAFCPNIGHGSVIVTTRLPDLVMGTPVRVQPLTAIEESLEILRKRSGRDSIMDDVGAHRLATRLSGLPLALATAGAYLRKSTLTFLQYLDVYERCWQVDPRRPLRLREYADRTLYTTWDLSYRRLQTEDMDAAQMLKLMAYFDHHEIWYDLWHAGLSGHSPAWLCTALADRMSFNSVITTLVDYCLVEVQHAAQSYSIHGCVHDWTLEVLNQDIESQLYWYAFDCVAASIDENDQDSLGHTRYARVSRHAVRLTRDCFTVHDDSGLSERLDAALLIIQILHEQVQLSAAEQMYRRVLAMQERVFGLDHTSTLGTVNDLGLLYSDQGKLNQAEQMLVRALAGKETGLGPEHISTLNTVNNLGILYYDQGKLNQAEQMYRRALSGRETVLGLEHTSTLNTVNNLGLLYYNQGKLDKAEQMLLRALAGKEAGLGLGHTSTLSTVNNLGSIYLFQGKLNQAEQMLVRALAGIEAVLGPEHTSTLDTISNLGLLYSNQGKLNQAEQMYRRALSGRETVLGLKHISTISAVCNLGSLFSSQDKLDEAEQMYTRALAVQEIVLGLEHISTLSTVNNLGILYHNQGKLDEAEQMFLQALAGKEVGLGLGHTSTLQTVNNLGRLYTHQGKLDKAEQMCIRARDGYEQASLGLTMPALNNAFNLGCLYQRQGRMDEAEYSFQRTVVGCEQMLGSSHVLTIEAMNSLSQLRLNMAQERTTSE